MVKISRNFTAGRMNKVLDERLVPQGEYIDALNIRMGSTEQSEIGVIENTKGNTLLTDLQFNGVFLSSNAKTIGSIADGEKEIIYWFVHDPSFPVSTEAPLGKIDMIVSFSEATNVLTYHIISVNDGGGINTTLNFNSQYLITGVNLIDNLLFFTDDYNQPRFFNTTRPYALPISGVDDSLLWEAILVIKRPPEQSPEVVMQNLSGQENYLKDRFICFAYRYQYADGEYSAISQFSAAAFFPQTFDITNEAFLNEGMINEYNAALVTVNTGGPLVKSIDLLFKDMNSNVIKVIEKINKQDFALSDDVPYSYIFSSSKVFTILPESELLRLYDNVPLAAKAQTIMGNRLMYGNYVEGYDLIDKDGSQTMLEYYLQGNSEVINNQSLTYTIFDGIYNFGSSNYSTPSCKIEIDLSPLVTPVNKLVQGAVININIQFVHDSFVGAPNPNEQTQSITLNFFFELPQDYNSVSDMVTSIDFQNAVGTSLNILPVYDPLLPTSCNGYTFTDSFNCNIPNSLGTTAPIYYKYASGINGPNEPIDAYVGVGTEANFLKFQILAMQFVDNLASPSQSLYEYYKIVDAQALFQQIGNSKSLHSNRDYEIGIVYMDEFNRSTTALVSPNNTIHFSCDTSDTKNSIYVIIPPTQIAPAWAKRYKFVIKPDKAGYETIYSNIYYKATNQPWIYFLLEGENARKSEVGDRYIVKADSLGPKSECVYTTVLEKSVWPSGQFATNSPAGVYIKLASNNISTDDTTPIYRSDNNKSYKQYCSLTSSYEEIPAYAILNVSDPDPNNVGQYLDIPIVEGTNITIEFNFTNPSIGCSHPRLEWNIKYTFAADSNYANLHSCFLSQNIFNIIQNQSNKSVYGCSSYNFPNVTYNTSVTNYASYDDFTKCALATTNLFSFEFIRDTSNNVLYLCFVGNKKYISPFDEQYVVYADGNAAVTIKSSGGVAIFETLPTDALPDVFYENELSLPIGPNPDFPALEDGAHGGNIQDQVFTTNTAAIVDTGFFNCYCFGNGAESYKIRDSIIGRTLELGNKVTSVAAQDYEQVDRFSDITYSGIYNNESNVNKLNEFNLGLLNYKHCETSFGPIYLLDGRQTDVLTLQEDKISYVLAGKNLLSDSAAGGAISSVPEVLGTQIARSEKYGISFNPESYVHWGYDRYFTDAKRGAVIQMKGDSYSNDQLKVVSEVGMRTWFRDLFKNSFQTQKLGAFDPYMNEYVLSSNDTLIPQPVECIGCGINQTFTFEEAGTISLCVEEGLPVGNVTISYNTYGGSPNDFIINATYNGTTYSTGLVTSSGTLIVPKSINNISTIDVEVIASDALLLDVNVSCVEAVYLTIVEVVVTNNYEAGKNIHTQYRYNIGTYNSPLQSSFVQFGSDTSNFVISRYNTNTGAIGTGAFPFESSVMRLISNQFSSDTFVFDPLQDSFKYLMSNTLYSNNTADITTLLSLANTATLDTVSASYNDATFTVPPVQQYLYLIWDFRDSVATDLCYGTDNLDVCCNCNNCGDEIANCRSFIISNAQAPYAEIVYVACEDTTPTTITVEPNKSILICINKDYPYPTITSGYADITLYKECGC